MKKHLIFGFLMVLLYCGSNITFGQKNNKGEQPFKLGVSQSIITPQNSIRMGGYSARKGPSIGINDELYASALLFSDDVNKVLIITADAIGFSNQFIDEVKTGISSKIGIPSDNIMISATHTHGGPATQIIEGEESSAVHDYLEFLKGKLILLSIDASKNVVPFRMGIGKSTSKMNINRRATFADGSIGLGKNPDGPVDHDVTVVKFEDLDGKILALYVNWPCHGTVGGSQNNMITGDWPGSVARYIKRQAGKDIVVAITLGASGNINPIYQGDSFKEIDAIGFNVGSNAWEMLSQISTYPVKSVQAQNATMKFPGKIRTNNYLPQESYEKGPEVELRLTAVKIEGLIICGISGELFTEFGIEIKKLSPYRNTLIVTHCNGANGYICTDKSYEEGGYEVAASRLLPGVEKPITDRFMELIRLF